jgi:hypothetical protein
MNKKRQISQANIIITIKGVFKMGRKPLPEHLRKECLQLRIKQWIVDEFKSQDGYNPEVEKILEEYLIKNGRTKFLRVGDEKEKI